MLEFPAKVKRKFKAARSKGQKKALVTKEPKLLVAQQSLSVVRFIDEISEIILELLIPALRDEQRQDGLPSTIQRVFDIVELRIGSIIDDTQIEQTSEKVGTELASASKKQWKRLLSVEIDPEVQPLIQTFVKNNTTLIKSQTSQTVAKIRQLVEGKVGTRVEDLAEQIEHTLGVQKSKARFIARDQTLKLNGQIAKATQESVGIEKYEWVTAGDDNVRETHEELNGTIHRWDTPPVISKDGRTGHPGEDYQCRCVPLAIIPD